MSQPLTLVSHLLCPYVQRAAIALHETVSYTHLTLPTILLV